MAGKWLCNEIPGYIWAGESSKTPFTTIFETKTIIRGTVHLEDRILAVSDLAQTDC
jgi:hypothetical protein